MLLSLKAFGKDISVNPKYVTSIAARKLKNYAAGPEFHEVVCLWVVGHAGYGTFEVTLKDTTVDEVTYYLNHGRHQ